MAQGWREVFWKENSSQQDKEEESNSVYKPWSVDSQLD